MRKRLFKCSVNLDVVIGVLADDEGDAERWLRMNQRQILEDFRESVDLHQFGEIKERKDAYAKIGSYGECNILTTDDLYGRDPEGIGDLATFLTMGEASGYSVADAVAIQDAFEAINEYSPAWKDKQTAARNTTPLALPKMITVLEDHGLMPVLSLVPG